MTRSTNTPPRHWPALRGQDGITMIVTISVMLITSLLLVAAFTSARGEIHLTGTDTAQKKAYYAAEAGVEDYEYHLTQDGNYLSYCTNPPVANPALNQVGSTANRAVVPGNSTTGEPSNESYAIQLLPAESAPEHSKCESSRLVETMLEEKSPGAVGTFRIESTGYSGNSKSTLVATFRNANFVSYVWYTKYETGDPAVYGEAYEKNPETYNKCGAFYGERPSYCSEFNNYFGTGESVNGPMHTEDHLGVCGSPVFGRTNTDRIEFGHAVGTPKDEGYSNEGLSACGTPTPTFKGNHIKPENVLSIEPPPGDEELQHIVEPSYLYKEKTEIALEGSTMTVITHKGSHPTPAEEAPPLEKKKEETKTGVAFPPNGVIYVSGGCSTRYSPFGPSPSYSADTTCGNVYVHGYYSSSLTIASENDIIINGNIYPTSVASDLGSEATGNALLGLIANNFVRIYHPLTGTREDKYTKCGSSQNDTVSTPETPKDLEEPIIYAAILAVKHAFIVDNFDCGTATLKHLNIYGAVAGLFSNGLTGTFGGGGGLLSGYGYNANYDNRLQVEEPPHFLNPIQADWFIQRQTVAPNPSY
jgi:Tfp pilus assembly protein PilX